MKILFIGAVKFSASALQELIAMRANVIGVCTSRESTINSDHVDLSSTAEQAGIPVKFAPNINSSEV